MSSTFTGILLDVSGSMSGSISGGVNQTGGPWARSIFTVIDDFVKHDVSTDNHIFTIGFGGRDKNVFDTIGTIKHFKEERNVYQGPARYETIQETFDVLERNGARTIRKWASTSLVRNNVSEHEAQAVLKRLKEDQEFRRQFVNEYLPGACRDWDDNMRQNDPVSTIFGGFLWLAQTVSSSVVSNFHQASDEDIDNVIKKAMRYIKRSILKDVCDQSIFNVHEAADVIHGCVDAEELTTERANELLKIVEPYIYGETPLYAALTEATVLFSRRLYRYQSHRRLLFVLSDGGATDTGYASIGRITSELQQASVTVVTCYISSSSNIESKKLHSSKEHNWDAGAKFLFNLSSKIPTDWVARAIFIKRGWKMDFSNNETRFFMHVNHPDNLEDVCDIAQNAVSRQDALSNMLVSVSLGVYINQKNTSISAHKQVGGTCYANASAAVLHLAMHRVLGRDGGYPKFEELRDAMIGRFGLDGANTLNVLKDVCPPYRLHCKTVNAIEAFEAVTKLHPVVVRFYLTEHEWDIFNLIYDDHNNRFRILKKSDIDRSKRSMNDGHLKGHAVVLTSYNSKCLRLMNSWGEEWADNGFFRVESADVLGLEFIDVFWTKDDLTQREKDFYRTHGPEVADKLMRSLKSLQEAQFTCPSSQCKRISNVTEFNGTVSQATCPRCGHEFPTADGEGNILALNIYLTSLSR